MYWSAVQCCLPLCPSRGDGDSVMLGKESLSLSLSQLLSWLLLFSAPAASQSKKAVTTVTLSPVQRRNDSLHTAWARNSGWGMIGLVPNWQKEVKLKVGWSIHPYAQVLAMFAFDSYSQSKRSPRPLSRHRPCKTPFPIGNASFNKPWPNYHGSIMFYSFLIESHRNAGFQRAFFRGHCWRPQTKTRSRPFS